MGNHSFFLFSTIQIIIGAPKMAVTALMGNVLLAMGICDTRSHTSISILPKRMVAGRIVLWFTVPKNALAKWGITTPTNAIGPVKAVTAPVTTAALTMMRKRVRLIFKPLLAA